MKHLNSGSASSAIPWEESRTCWGLAALLSSIPFLFSPIPMLPDLFSHMGRYHVMNFASASDFLQAYYRFEWKPIGNLGVDVLMVPLGRLLGTEAATRLIVAAIPPLTVFGIRTLALAATGRAGGAALGAILPVWSFSFFFGFVNYCLGIALALFAVASWIRMVGRGAGLRWLLFLPAALILWICHVAAWGVFLIIVAGWEAGRSVDQRRFGAFRLLGLLIKMLPLAAPALVTIGWRVLEPGTDNHYGGFGLASKVNGLLSFFRASDRFFDLSSLGAMLLLAAVCLAVTQRRQTGFVLAAAALFSCFFLLPEILLASAFAADRMLLPAFILLFISASELPQRWSRLIALCSLCLLSARILITSLDWHRRGALLSQELAVLDVVPRGARIATASRRGACNNWQPTGFDHLPNLAIIRREAFVNSEWDQPGANLLTPIYNRGQDYNASPSNLVGPDCEGRLAADWYAQLPRERLDYLWTFAGEPPPQARSWLELVAKGPNSTLFRIRNR